LLDGVESSTATLEESLAFLPKLTIILLHDSTNSPKVFETLHSNRNIHIRYV
jgi:hypothetical protein